MPLKPGSDDATVSENVSELMRSGKFPHDQAIAIAMDSAGRSAPVTLEDMAKSYMPSWLKERDKPHWLKTFIETYNETGDEEKAALAATGRVSKRRILGLKSVEGMPVVAGWGLLFTDEDDLDLQKTYFTQDTPLLLDFYQNAPLFWEHGEEPQYGVDPIGRRVKAELYPRGVWVEHELFPEHPYFDRTCQAVERGEVGYSSDTIGHLAEKEYNAEDGRLGWWAAAAWSLTRNPAEPALGAVTFRKFAHFAKALKSDGQRSRTSVYAMQSLDNSYTGAGATMPNEILAQLCAALGLPPDSSPELIEQAVTQAINEMESNPDHMNAVHAAMGGLPEVPPDKAALAEKLQGLLKMAVEPEKQDTPPPPPPEPETAMSHRAAPDYEALGKAYIAGSKAQPRGSNMPYKTNTQKNRDGERSYSTRFNVNRGATAPTVYDTYRDMVLISRGMAPQKFTSAKAMSYATGPAGGYVLEQEVSDQILDPLRASAVVFTMGARQEDMDGLQTKSVPAMQTAPSAYWVGEAQTVTDSQPQYRMINLVPKPLACLVQRPFSFFKNMTPNAEGQLKKEIQKSLALAIDIAALTGTGGAAASPNTGASPRGILNITGVTNTTLDTNGRNPVLQDLIDCDKRLDAANIPEGGERGFIFHSNIKQIFNSMSDANGQPLFREAWGGAPGKTLIGYPFACSNQISTSVSTGTNNSTTYIFFGDWRYLVVGLTTTIELVLDQTYAASLLQGLLAYVYCDVQVDYAQGFQVLSGVTYA
jgi:HK97 family phage major capsid protein